MKIKWMGPFLLFVSLPTLAERDRVHFHPYAPQKNEYELELGGMWEKNNLSWIGLTYGRHIGRCVFSESQKCQQYLDFTGGAGSRQGEMAGLALLGVRWQYVSFPKPYSPSMSVFTGLMSLNDDVRDRRVGVYGVGLGYTASLHEKLDVKWENRIGGGNQFWMQSMISISLKIDHWVDHFADQMKAVGQTTVEATGTVFEATGQVIKSTVTAPKTFVDWFNAPNGQTTAPELNNQKERPHDEHESH